MGGVSEEEAGRFWANVWMVGGILAIFVVLVVVAGQFGAGERSPEQNERIAQDILEPLESVRPELERLDVSTASGDPDQFDSSVELAVGALDDALPAGSSSRRRMCTFGASIVKDFAQTFGDTSHSSHVAVVDFYRYYC